MPLSFRSKPQKAPEPAETAGAQKSLERPSAEEIYRHVLQNAKDELCRSTTSLAISGFAGGTFMGLSALGNALALSMLGSGPIALFCAKMFYPLGFIVVVVGRAQLFTENTLYPVALVLAEKKHFLKTLRLWATVLPTNMLGALAFATLASYTAALNPHVQAALVKLGMDALDASPATIFWSGVMGGWIIAMMAWLVSASHSITGSVALIWVLTFVVGLGGFAHCIATSGEVLTAVLLHHARLSNYFGWFLPAVGGNICGGIGMVTILEYGQVVYGGDGTPTGQSSVEQARRMTPASTTNLGTFIESATERQPGELQVNTTTK